MQASHTWGRAGWTAVARGVADVCAKAAGVVCNDSKIQQRLQKKVSFMAIWSGGLRAYHPFQCASQILASRFKSRTGRIISDVGVTQPKVHSGLLEVAFSATIYFTAN